MVRRLITKYAMLTSERRRQTAEEIQARGAACIAVGLPLDSPKPEEEEQQPEDVEGEPLPEPMEVADPQEEEVEQPAPRRGRGVTMAEAEAEFAVTQAVEMAEQQAILESIQDEAYVEANWQFLRQERAASDTLIAELDVDIEAEEAGVEKPKALELPLPSMYPQPGREIVNISADGPGCVCERLRITTTHLDNKSSPTCIGLAGVQYSACMHGKEEQAPHAGPG
ncbi:uncharacterized protein [Triticum aestivum]|uniref:uncharacterized protein n=1 Tax=Triticum aestivum TaxID=4565 RepID=UPI001D00E8F3|nr:uncharacterized protein LOC123082369 [Triticum aestivum]